MPATIRDVARHAGVGVGTVSRVLNDSPAVSTQTRNKVLKAIAALDYSPNVIARRLSLGKTLTIAVIAPFLTRPSVVERLRGVESVLSQTEYDLVLHNVESGNRYEAYFRDVPRRERIDGLLVISLRPPEAHVRRLREYGGPTILVDIAHPDFSRVVIDDVDGGYKATKHLLDLGHRRIGFLSDFTDSSFHFTANRDRFRGYEMALAAFGIEARADYSVHGEHSRESAHEQATRLLTLSERPTAIFATCDTLATGVLEAAQELELSLPEDLSIIGYDDIEIAEYLNLTTVRQQLFESGVRGGELLLEAIESSPDSPREIVLPTELVVRATTAAPPEC
ncbi:MAG: LacI family DNA-binding transcriptional regulator [Anaerolineae bacterium]|nr:LacI family DNA-binding transcriptional regulator [Anaerolineae bacterium]